MFLTSETSKPYCLEQYKTLRPMSEKLSPNLDQYCGASYIFNKTRRGSSSSSNAPICRPTHLHLASEGLP